MNPDTTEGSLKATKLFLLLLKKLSLEILFNPEKGGFQTLLSERTLC